MANINVVHDRRDRFIAMIIGTLLLLIVIAFIAKGLGYHDPHTGTSKQADHKNTSHNTGAGGH